MSFMDKLKAFWAELEAHLASFHDRITALENHPALKTPPAEAGKAPEGAPPAPTAPAASPHVVTNAEHYGSAQTASYLGLDPNAPFVDKPVDSQPTTAAS